MPASLSRRRPARPDGSADPPALGCGLRPDRGRAGCRAAGSGGLPGGRARLTVAAGCWGAPGGLGRPGGAPADPAALAGCWRPLERPGGRRVGRAIRAACCGLLRGREIRARSGENNLGSQPQGRGSRRALRARPRHSSAADLAGALRAGGLDLARPRSGAGAACCGRPAADLGRCAALAGRAACWGKEKPRRDGRGLLPYCGGRST